MKIEKLNDYQIKFMLSNQDLKERNITFTDLLQRSDKLQGLVHEIMKKASETIDFNVSETPVMVEALPHKDGIALIVSKTSADKLDANASPIFNDEHRKHLKNLYNEFLSDHKQPDLVNNNAQDTNAISDVNKNKLCYFMYTFKNLENVIDACNVINRDYNDESMLYKMNNAYFLVLKCAYKDLKESVKNSLTDFGESYPYFNGRYGMLQEYGKILIKTEAIQALAHCK